MAGPFAWTERRWFASADPAARSFVRYDYPAADDRSIDGPSSGCPSGGTQYERVLPSRFDVLVECHTAAVLVLKVTYYPNWRVVVDGVAQATFMVSPSFIGIALNPGQYFVTGEYRPTPVKMPLLVSGASAIALLLLIRRRLDPFAMFIGRRFSKGST